MPDTEKDMLFMSVGFLGALYLMTHFVSLRPARAKSLMSMDLIPDRPEFVVPKQAYPFDERMRMIRW